MTSTLSNNPILRIVVLCILYCAQGIPHGFVTIALTAWLIEQLPDMLTPLEKTKAVAVVVTASILPWTFKWAWGPAIDRFQIRAYGKRRPWILFAQSMMILTALGLLLIPNPVEAIWTLATVVAIHNVFSGLQDVSVDALAVDLLRPEERGRANGLMYGTKFLGTSIGAAGLGYILANSGFAAAVLLMAGMLAAIMCVPLFIRERPGEQLLPFKRNATGHLVSHARDAEEGSANASLLQLTLRLFRAFGRRNTLIAAILALVIWIPNGLVYPRAMTLFIDELGWTQEAYTSITGTFGVIAGLIGAVVGGFIADLIGPRKVAAIASVLFGCLLGFFAIAPESLWENTTFVSFYLVAKQGLQGLLSVALFSIFMSVSWKIVAATQFTAYMSLLNLSYSLGTAYSPSFDEVLGVRNVFLLAGIFQILVIVLLPFCNPWKGQSEPTKPS